MRIKAISENKTFDSVFRKNGVVDWGGKISTSSSESVSFIRGFIRSMNAMAHARSKFYFYKI